MRFSETALEGVILVELEFHEDDRGWFVETYDAGMFGGRGMPTRWEHDSWSYSVHAGTVRGLHFQAHPREQAKLVRVPHGRVFDVAVNITPGSPSFGEHVGVELDATCALYVPVGFAHGFCTLEPGTEVSYKMSVPYVSELARGIAWDDPELGIAWPVGPSQVLLSDRDRNHPTLGELDG